MPTALYRAERNERAGSSRSAEKAGARERSHVCMVLFTRPPAGGAGGSELSDRARPGALAEGRERAGASGGWVGERFFGVSSSALGFLF